MIAIGSDGMTKDIMNDIRAICARYDIDALYTFGSRALEVGGYIRGRGGIAHETKVDVDMAVLPKKGCYLSPRERVRLTLDLEDLLGVYMVDLVILSEAPPFLALDIIRGEELYSADPDRTAEYELYVMRRAGDLAYFERQRRAQILRGTDL